jgi:hypothetical protein
MPKALARCACIDAWAPHTSTLDLEIAPMVIEEAVRARINALLHEAQDLWHGNENDQCVDPHQMASCSGWLTAAQNAVHVIVSAPDAPYRKKVDRIAEASHGYGAHDAVREVSLVLINLLRDADAGMLATVADQARAETFDDFLDHASYYLKNSRKQEAAVIAGVVFEDATRRVCRKLGIAEKGEKLDTLISVLATRGEFTGVKAKRARAAADVRTRATHAQWDEFELEDVRATIELARELIEAKLV